MQDKQKYFVFNKETDYTRGYSLNLATTPEGISIDNRSSTGMAVFISRLLDSREKETKWHRIVVDSKDLGDSSIRFTFYSCEERKIEVDGMILDIDEVIKDPAISYSEKAALFDNFKIKTVLNPVDMLLHEASGRYLWFMAELFGQGEDSPQIHKIKIYFPKETWLEYLPEIYQQDPVSKSFLERYLGIIQSLFLDMEHNIDGIARYFDPDVAEGDFLNWLAGWVSIDDGYIWSEDKLRYLIKNAMRLYKMRGTLSAMSEIIELYTGQKPYIVERYQVDRYLGEAKTAELLTRLYGDNPYVITIVVSEDCIPSTKEYKSLRKIVDSCKPAHIEANLVVLKPYVFIDRYSYLGINSVLGRYRALNLDGFSAIPFTNVTENDETLNKKEGRVV